MSNGYRINVAHNGRHFFATDPDSAQTKEKAKELYDVLKEKFPKSEGYEITVTRWESIGHYVNFD